MTRAEQYRAHAIDAERQAQRMCDREARATLERVAIQWRRMAEQVERYPLGTGTTETDQLDLVMRLDQPASAASRPAG